MPPLTPQGEFELVTLSRLLNKKGENEYILYYPFNLK